MSTIADKLEYLNETKQAIKTAIVEKGVEVADTDTFRSYADKIAEIQTGGGEVEEQELYLCRVIDWEGTVLKEEWLPAGATFTMPADPTYEGLVFDGWSSPFELTNNQIVVEDRDIIIGAMYHTASGMTEIDIELTQVSGLTISNPAGNYTSIDWGDGSTEKTSTHTYAEYGKYTIKIADASTKYVSSSSALFGSANQATSVVSFRFGENFGFYHDFNLSYCVSMKAILLPNQADLSRLSIYGSNGASVLKGVVIKTQTTTISSNFMGSCYRADFIVVPQGLTTIPGSFCSGCRNLQYISLPKGITASSSFLRDTGIVRLCIDAVSLSDILNGNDGNYTVKELTINYSGTTTSGSICGVLYALEKLTFKATNLVTVNGSFATNCRSLKYIDIENVTTKTSGNYTYYFYNCFNLRQYYCPPNVETIPNQSYYQVYGTIDRAVITDNITNLYFEYMYGVKSIVLPPNLTTLSASFGQRCSNCLLYDFSRATVIPSFTSGGSPFYLAHAGRRIVVPDELYDSWIAASTWSSHVNNTYRVSDVQHEIGLAVNNYEKVVS